MRDVLAALCRHAAVAPHRTAVIDAEGTVSYGELCDAVRRLAAWAQELPATVGVLAPKDRRALVWHLALAWAGRTVVPLPEFFSAGQLAHLVDDAEIAAVVARPETLAALAPLGVPAVQPDEGLKAIAEPAGGARWIIYTSGTTGQPKGVMLGERQIDASVRALAEATAAVPDDRMLSVLPFALLLELVSGIALPLFVGGSVAVCLHPHDLAAAAETFDATATVLVPELLAGWVAGLERSGRRGPACLRFIAVGGAPVPPELAERAWALGLRVHEGYGLSECCSVVAVNRPGERVAGTVGRPLPGVTVAIDDGEIVVSGPTVMDGYRGGQPAFGVRRTGDAGRFDAAGRLIVDGRIDDVIVTSAGRNLHPEWIEAMILNDPRVARCAVVGGDTDPRAVLVPAGSVLGIEDAEALVAQLTAAAPEFARPRRTVVMSEELLVRLGLITAGGRLRRRAIAAFLQESP